MAIDKNYAFTCSRDALGRLRIDTARLTGGWSDPMGDLHSLYRREILFRPTSPKERELLFAARKLPPDQQRVVAHYILAHRTDVYKHDLNREAEQATALRRQDAVDSENRRQAHYLASLGRIAEREAEQARQAAQARARAEHLRHSVIQPVLTPASASTALSRIGEGLSREEELEAEEDELER